MADISGTGARDTLAGTVGADVISGREGSDTIHAGSGDDIVYGFGASDLDPEEDAAMTTHDMGRLDADAMGADAGPCTAAVLAPRAGAAAGWYMHIDLDVAGPEEVPGQLTNAPHWPSREALLASVQAAARAVPLRCLGIAAYDPAGDPEGRGARLAVDLAVTALAGIRTP